MKIVQRHVTKRDRFLGLLKLLYYVVLLPCALFFAFVSFIFTGNPLATIFMPDNDLRWFFTLMWAVVLIPFVYRRIRVAKRRRQLKKMVAMMSHPERFNPQKQHQVLNPASGKYLGIDIQRGTILYIHMARKGIIDVIGLTMSDWTNREWEDGWFRLYTRMPDVPVLSVDAHLVAKDLFNTLGAMNHNRYPEPFPNEPWPEFVRNQSRFVEFEHDVVVPQIG